MPETRSKVGGWPLATALAALLALLFFVRGVLLPFVLAAAVAFILTPVVDHMHRRLKTPRWIVVLVIYLILVGCLALVGYWVGGVMVRDVVDIVRQFPQLLHKAIGDVVSMASGLVGQIDVNAVAKEVLSDLGAVFGGGLGLRFAGYGVATIFGAILMLVLLIYLLISGKQVAAGVFWLVPPEYRDGVGSITDKVLPMLWRYFVGLLGVITYTTCIAAIGFGAIFLTHRRCRSRSAFWSWFRWSGRLYRWVWSGSPPCLQQAWRSS